MNSIQLSHGGYFELNLTIKLNPDQNQITLVNKRNGIESNSAAKDKNKDENEGEPSSSELTLPDTSKPTDNERINMMAKQFEDHKKNLDYFPMTASVKGKVIIINNSFAGTQNARKGLRKDVQDLQNVFSFLGSEKSEVETTTLPNLSSREIREELKQFAASVRRPGFYAIVILTHGGSRVTYDGSLGNIIIGDDGTPLDVKEIIDIFSGVHLKEIPVLMFFQVYRGKKLNRNEYRQACNPSFSEASETDEDDRENEAQHMEDAIQGSLYAILRKILQKGISLIPCTEEEDDIDAMREVSSTGNEQTSTEHDADTENMLISFSTTEEYLSEKTKTTRSFFVQTLCEEVRKSAHEKDFIEVMKDVHRIVQKKGASELRSRDSLIACDTAHTLKKKLLFFPGFPK